MVWAAAREMAPQIMASQKWRRREGGGGVMEEEEYEMAAAAAPPRWSSTTSTLLINDFPALSRFLSILPPGNG